VPNQSVKFAKLLARRRLGEGLGKDVEEDRRERIWECMGQGPVS